MFTNIFNKLTENTQLSSKPINENLNKKSLNLLLSELFIISTKFLKTSFGKKNAIFTKLDRNDNNAVQKLFKKITDKQNIYDFNKRSFYIKEEFFENINSLTPFFRSE
jgi:hypothetical protein